MNKLAVIILSLLLSMTSAHSAEFAETDISEEMSTELQKNPSKKRFGPGVTKIEKKKASQSLGISMGRYFLSMLIILLLIGGFFYGLKKFSNKVSGQSGYGSMNVQQRLVIDGKNTLVLVKVHEEEMLLATGPQGTRLISKFATIDLDNEAFVLDDDKDDDNDDDDNDDDDDEILTSEFKNCGFELLEKLNWKKG
ncbi:MAG: flagellar biosynthetic protein FliO [Lentisphaeria bacterium]|nr:flagellar biosynthetic protein FliO [Lentisphaeria bacterium]